MCYFLVTSCLATTGDLKLCFNFPVSSLYRSLTHPATGGSVIFNVQTWKSCQSYNLNLSRETMSCYSYKCLETNIYTRASPYEIPTKMKNRSGDSKGSHQPTLTVFRLNTKHWIFNMCCFGDYWNWKWREIPALIMWRDPARRAFFLLLWSLNVITAHVLCVLTRHICCVLAQHICCVLPQNPWQCSLNTSL